MVDIKLGYACNNFCIHCVVDPIREELVENNSRLNKTFDEIISQIETAYNNGIHSIVLTGGEPTLRNDFVDIVQYVSKKGMHILLQTNARRLSSWELCQKLANVEDILYIVALHSSVEKIHDEITRVKGSFRETVQAISNLIRLNKAVSTKIVLSNLNHLELLETIKFAKNIGVRRASVAFPHALGFSINRFEEVVPYYQSLKDQVTETAIWSDENNFWVDFETIPFCISPKTVPFWKRNCDLFSTSNFIRFGGEKVSVASSQLPDWEYLRPTMKRKAASCSLCFFERICEGPWIEYVDKRGFSEFLPVNDPTVLSLIDSFCS